MNTFREVPKHVRRLERRIFSAYRILAATGILQDLMEHGPHRMPVRLEVGLALTFLEQDHQLSDHPFALELRAFVAAEWLKRFVDRNEARLRAQRRVRVEGSAAVTPQLLDALIELAMERIERWEKNPRTNA